MYTFHLQPFEGGRDADVALGENEFDPPALEGRDINTLHSSAPNKLATKKRIYFSAVKQICLLSTLIYIGKFHFV